MNGSGHIRKITAIILTVAAFISTASFSSDATNAISDNKVLLIDDEGEEIEVSVSQDDMFNADDEDVEKLVDESKKAAAEFENRREYAGSDSGVVICDDDGNYSDAAFDDDWSLILINKEHHIPDDYQFELGTIKGAIKSDVRVTEHILEMIQAAKADGITICICSPYRDMDKQTMLFERKKKSYIRQGYTEQEAYDLASDTVAIPGTSEHQVGLAFDLVSDDYKNLDAGFGDTAAGKWLQKNSPDYGFILRYPKGKEAVTEIEYEPWHFRYVGEKAAKDITSQGLCLEEYDKMIGLVE